MELNISRVVVGAYMYIDGINSSQIQVRKPYRKTRRSKAICSSKTGNGWRRYLLCE